MTARQDSGNSGCHGITVEQFLIHNILALRTQAPEPARDAFKEAGT